VDATAFAVASSEADHAGLGYGVAKHLGIPSSPAADVTFTMRPGEPESTQWRTAARLTSMLPRRFTRASSQHRQWREDMPVRSIAAMFKTPSILPHGWTTAATAASTAAASGDIGRDHHRVPPSCAAAASATVRRFRCHHSTTDIQQRDRVAVLHQVRRNRLPCAAGTGDGGIRATSAQSPRHRRQITARSRPR